MKLTLEKIKQLIKEEIKKDVSEVSKQQSPPTVPNVSSTLPIQATNGGPTSKTIPVVV